MKLIDNLKLNSKINLLVTGLLAIILIVFGLLIYKVQKNKLVNNVDSQLQVYLQDLNYIIEEKINVRKEAAISVTDYYLYELRAMQLTDSGNAVINRENAVTYLISKINVDEIIRDEINNYFSGREAYVSIPFKVYLIYRNGKGVEFPNNEAWDISGTKLYDKIKFVTGDKILKTNFLWPEKGDREEKFLYLLYQQSNNAFLAIVTDQYTLEKDLLQLRNFIAVGIFISIIAIWLLLSLQIKSVTKHIHLLSETVKDMSRGKTASSIYYKQNDELKEIVESVNSLIKGLRQTTLFSKEIGKGNLAASFTPLSEEDELGNSLLEMRKSLHEAEQDRTRQKHEEEERNWSSIGHAKFADILRHSVKDIGELSYYIISELVKYLNVTQGGIYLLNTNDKASPHLEMLSCFAYDRRKFMVKRIEIGEGLVGQCFKEGSTIYLTDLPEGYMDIVSGLGDANPRSLLIVPLKLNDEIHGVVELASLNIFEPYKIHFVENIGEIVASTLSSVRGTMNTEVLLEQYQQQSEELKSQEEELRQNMEELQATQEESVRRESELDEMLKAINTATGIIEFDLLGNIITANKHYLKIAEVTNRDIEDKSIMDFMAPELANSEKIKGLWENLAAGEIHTGVHKYIFKGKDKNFYETFTPVKDENGIYYKIIALSRETSQS